MWRRVLGTGDRLVVHLINLAGQDDAEWDAPRKPVADLPCAARCDCDAPAPTCPGYASPTRTAKPDCAT